MQEMLWRAWIWKPTMSFEGRVAEASARLNDKYLRANRQKDGVRSYGRMVDLMLAYYKDQL